MGLGLRGSSTRKTKRVPVKRYVIREADSGTVADAPIAALPEAASNKQGKRVIQQSLRRSNDPVIASASSNLVSPSSFSPHVSVAEGP